MPQISQIFTDLAWPTFLQNQTSLGGKNVNFFQGETSGSGFQSAHEGLAPSGKNNTLQDLFSNPKFVFLIKLTACVLLMLGTHSYYNTAAEISLIHKATPLAISLNDAPKE